MKDKQLYYDDVKKQQYWIEWEETGNNDIPHRHYITNDNNKIVKAIQEILWMARRYADGRQTFAPISFNDAYDTLRDAFGTEIEYNITKWKDHTLMDNGKYFPYAQDGGDFKIFDCVTERKYYKLKKE